MAIVLSQCRAGYFLLSHWFLIWTYGMEIRWYGSTPSLSHQFLEASWFPSLAGQMQSTLSRRFGLDLWLEFSRLAYLISTFLLRSGPPLEVTLFALEIPLVCQRTSFAKILRLPLSNPAFPPTLRRPLDPSPSRHHLYQLYIKMISTDLSYIFFLPSKISI